MQLSIWRLDKVDFYVILVLKAFDILGNQSAVRTFRTSINKNGQRLFAIFFALLCTFLLPAPRRARSDHSHYKCNTDQFLPFHNKSPFLVHQLLYVNPAVLYIAFITCFHYLCHIMPLFKICVPVRAFRMPYSVIEISQRICQGVCPS